ncbi:MAG: hypothetical protein K0R54_2009 [Clostridiaceae bacterium]|jgi:uncharacterized lipoprotein YddW (UPF0748 family)|nr:hypothetical protein [Clostridiaceae bacterium]
MKKITPRCISVFVFILVMLIGIPNYTAHAAAQSETRAVWISTVYNIDWPKTADPRQELSNDFDLLQRTGLNTVYLQVRSMGDALYPTSYAPWSKYLTGTLGKDPGYDPLAYAIAESKKKSLQLHAWFNPFRISDSASFDKNDYLSKLPNGNILKNNPQWLVTYANYTMINPGIPEARAYVIKTIMDVVNRYDIAGVHLDDYFYPYPKTGYEFDDSNEYNLYGSGMTLDDWRRDNVNKFVKDLNSAIKSSNKDIKFGISPFGIWKNSAAEGGSNTNGLESYYATYSDSVKWVKNNWVDYIVPQVYWSIGNNVADFERIVKWWNEVVKGTNVNLIIGQAAYKLGGEFSSSDEIINQIKIIRTLDNVKGNSIFSFSQIKEDKLGLRSKLDNLYNQDWKFIDNKWYFFNSYTGEKYKGWLLDRGIWYYLDPVTGAMKTGWLFYNGNWYYLNISGKMQTSWAFIGGVWYYFRPSGAMSTGWVSYNNKWYYMDSSGAMRTGWIWYNGKWYYCRSDGSMVY